MKGSHRTACTTSPIVSSSRHNATLKTILKETAGYTFYGIAGAAIGAGCAFVLTFAYTLIR